MMYRIRRSCMWNRSQSQPLSSDPFMVRFLGGPFWSQGLDSVVVVGPLQLWDILFCSVTFPVLLLTRDALLCPSRSATKALSPLTQQSTFPARDAPSPSCAMRRTTSSPTCTLAPPTSSQCVPAQARALARQRSQRSPPTYLVGAVESGSECFPARV